MKLEQIELDLCVNVVPYPHEEIEELEEVLDKYYMLYLKEVSNTQSQEVEVADLKRQIRNYEVNAKGFHRLVADMSSKLSQERLLTNETLMAAEAWKRKAEAWEDAYRSCKEDLHRQFNKETNLCNDWDNVRDELNRKYEELLTEYNRMTTKSEDIYNTLHEAYEYLYQKQHETKRAWFKDLCESKQKYEELLVKHAKVLEENVKFQK